MKTKLSIAIASIALVCVPMAAHAASSAPKPAASPTLSGKALSARQVAEAQNKVRTILYSVTANSGTLTPLAGVKNGYSLVLKGVDPSTTWFTDRPYRDSGVLPSQTVAKAFAETRDPANIALVLHQSTQGTDTLVAIMRKSAYDVTSQTLTAELRLLSAQEQREVSAGLNRHVKRADMKAPLNFQEASLFIDTSYSGTTPPTSTNPPNPQVGDVYSWIQGSQGCSTVYQYNPYAMGATNPTNWYAIGGGCGPSGGQGGGAIPFMW